MPPSVARCRDPTDGLVDGQPRGSDDRAACERAELVGVEDAPEPLDLAVRDRDGDGHERHHPYRFRIDLRQHSFQERNPTIYIDHRP